MNYIQWNNAIVNHFFNIDKDGHEVILYFSEEIINEIGEDAFPQMECTYSEDFLASLRRGVSDIPNNDYLGRMIELNNRYQKGWRGIDGLIIAYPPYFAYLLSFLLPFTSGELQRDFSANNFYNVVCSYFVAHRLVADEECYNNCIQNKLHRIDYLWDDIFNWLFETKNLSLGYIEKIDDPAANRRYVSKYEYHILLRKEQEDKLTTIFDENDILPHEPIGNDRMAELLIANRVSLHLSANAFNSIVHRDYIGEKLLSRAMNYYYSWNGTNNYSDVAEQDNTILKRGYSRARIVLCLVYNVLTRAISLLHFRLYSENGIPEDSKIRSDGNVFLSIKQSVLHPHYSSNFITENPLSIDADYVLIDSVNHIKYSRQKKDFYLFRNEQSLREWVEIPKVEYNTNRTLVITSIFYFQSELQDWYDDIPVENKRKTELRDNWIVLEIKQITKYNHPSITALQTIEGATKSINFDHQFYMDGCFFKGVLPRVWAENFEVGINDTIVADFEDKEISLNLEEGSKYYYFPDDFPIESKFRLKCGNVISHNFYSVQEFVNKTTNERIDLLQRRRNLIGAIQQNLTTDYIQGLCHCFSQEKRNNLRIFQNILEQNAHIFKNINDANAISYNQNYDTANIGNVLLNYISAKGKLTKSECVEAAAILLQSNNTIDDPKKVINASLYDMQDLGYIDYDATEGIVCVNRSAVVIKPSPSGTTIILVGARDNQFIKDIINGSTTSGYFIDVQTIDGLIPQTIFIKFKSYSHIIIEHFVQKFGLIFNNENKLFTQFALANAIDLCDWNKYISKATDIGLASDFEGGELFDIIKLQYVPKPEDFDKNISLLRYKKINGFKKAYRLWYKGEAYIIPEGHYGVYLYLYLYSELEKEQLKVKYTNNKYMYYEEFSRVSSLTNILVYNNERHWLGIPLTCPLPKYYATAFTLLSGTKPILLKYHDRTYKVYKNVKNLFCINSLNGLHQTFIGNNQSNKIFNNE